MGFFLKMGGESWKNKHTENVEQNMNFPSPQIDW